MIRIAASAANGIILASGMNNSMISRRTTAWIMPETGVDPPFLIFATVLAIAPVAGIPPNKPEAILATPCATSSILERCLEPIIPSATTAESKDSMEPRIAIVKAGPMSSLRSASVTTGI